MRSWHVRTLSGSVYFVHQLIGGEWVLTTDNVPSERSEDLRGLRLPLLEPPAPWPPRVGRPLLLVIGLPGRVKLRRTSLVLSVEGPQLGAEA
jgi:hypothetical protein